MILSNSFCSLLSTSSQTVDALSDIAIPELIERLSGAIDDFIDDISSRLLDIDLKIICYT